jgi:hypothetical protein
MGNNIINKINEHIESMILDADTEFIQELALSESISYEEIEDSANLILKQALFKIRSTSNKRKDDQILQTIALDYYDAIQKNLDKPVSYLHNLASNNRLGIQYRSLDKLSLEEIREIIKDQNLIELMERIKGGEE